MRIRLAAALVALTLGGPAVITRAQQPASLDGVLNDIEKSWPATSS